MRALPVVLIATLALASGPLLAAQDKARADAQDGTGQSQPESTTSTQAAADAIPEPAAAGATTALPEDWNLLHGLVRHCQQAFAGRVATNKTPDGPDPAWQGEPVVLNLRACPPGGVIIAIAVGEDRSRTMVLRQQSADQLSLRHLRHNDEGQPQPVSDFGGFSAEGSEPRKAVFQANDISRDLFTANGQAARNNSTWTLAMPDADTLVYEQDSDAGTLRLEFDLGKPVTQPALPWVEGAVR